MRLRTRSLLLLPPTSRPDPLHPLQAIHSRDFPHKISGMNILQPLLSANPNIPKIWEESSRGGAPLHTSRSDVLMERCERFSARQVLYCRSFLSMDLRKFAARCAAKLGATLFPVAAVTLITTTAAAQTTLPAPARHETNTSRQARIQRTIQDTYTHRWEIYGGGGYM